MLMSKQQKKQIRAKFRREVFSRDDFKCVYCHVLGDESTLDAHHIINRNNMPDGGYVKDNGITLCKAICHLRAENNEKGFQVEDLRKMIGIIK